VEKLKAKKSADTKPNRLTSAADQSNEYIRNRNPDLKAPLTQPGLDVKEGQYLVAVNGIPVTDCLNLYSLFQNTAGKANAHQCQY